MFIRHYFKIDDSCGLFPTPPFNNDAGIQLQQRAWTHVNAMVVEHITLMITMSDYSQRLLS